MGQIRGNYSWLAAYNEETPLPRVLRRIERLGASLHVPITVVVYNDGSIDSTSIIARQWQKHLSLVLLGCAQNKGLGAGLRALVQHVVETAHDEDILVMMDCDDTHNPSQIRAMLSSIEDGADVVIASRFIRGAIVRGVPRLRRITAFGAAVLCQLIHPVQGVQDYTCGYRAYRISALKPASDRYGAKLVEESEFSCIPELLLKLNVLGFKFTEVPLQLRYDLKPSPSKMGVNKNINSLVSLLVYSRLHGLNPS